MYVVSLLQPSESDYAACQIIIITLSNFLLYQVANEEIEIQENSKYLAQVYILISLATFSVCKIKESEFQKNSVFLYPIVMHSLLHFHSYPIFALVYFLKDSGALLRLQNKEESRKLILLTKLSLTHPTQQKGLLQFSSRPCVVRVSTFVAKSLFCATINDEIGFFFTVENHCE